MGPAEVSLLPADEQLRQLRGAADEREQLCLNIGGLVGVAAAAITADPTDAAGVVAVAVSRYESVDQETQANHRGGLLMLRYALGSVGRDEFKDVAMLRGHTRGG